MPKIKYKAIIFDLDGTLLDTLTDLADSMNIALEHLGCPGHPRDAYRYFVGDGMKNLARRVLPPERRDKESIASCMQEMTEVYARRWTQNSKLYAGVPQMLTSLVDRGLTLTIFSNKPDDFTQKCVQHFLNKWPFAEISGAKDNIPKKPAPDGALTIAHNLGLKPADFLYLGDTNTDMKTATSAGMHPVGALWGFRSAEELTSAGAKELLTAPTDLFKYL